MSYEEPDYTALRESADVEYRQYKPHLVAVDRVPS